MTSCKTSANVPLTENKKTAPVFAPTLPEDVFGMLQYDGPPKTLEEMDAAIAEEVKRRHRRYIP
jgi:hypothetical protein